MSLSTGRFVVGNALCFLEDARGSCQLNSQASRNPIDVYLNCSIVSLRSALANNDCIDVALVVNFEIPPSRRLEIEQFGIAIHRIDFTSFRMPDSFPWASAYFKLDALAYLSARYEKAMLLDCDTFTVGSYADLWQECERQILLYDLGHRISHPDRQRIIQNHTAMFGENTPLIHYGGELVAGPQMLLKPFVEKCQEAFCVIRDRSHQLVHDMGDEQILSIAAHRMPALIRSANSYLYRYWTNLQFRLISTNYQYNAVDIWHLPSEKENGLQALYRHLRRHGQLPDRKACIRIFNLDRPHAGRIREKLRQIKNRCIYR